MPTDALLALLHARSAVLADVEQEPHERLLVRSDRTGTMQLYELTKADGNFLRGHQRRPRLRCGHPP